MGLSLRRHYRGPSKEQRLIQLYNYTPWRAILNGSFQYFNRENRPVSIGDGVYKTFPSPIDCQIAIFSTVREFSGLKVGKDWWKEMEWNWKCHRIDSKKTWDVRYFEQSDELHCKMLIIPTTWLGQAPLCRTHSLYLLHANDLAFRCSVGFAVSSEDCIELYL